MGERAHAHTIHTKAGRKKDEKKYKIIIEIDIKKKNLK